MKNLLRLSMLLLSQSAFSQFYYNDIISPANISKQMNEYVMNKVATINATATDAYGMRNNSFYELHEVNENGKVLEISKLDETGKFTSTYRFGNNSQLLSQEDSAYKMRNVTTYKYDNNNRVISILNTTYDPENEFNETEEHVWLYNSTGLPVKMWKIVNGKDSLQYEFSLDENKNIVDEYMVRNKAKYDPAYYYYYDESNRLTDIARYNKIAKKILPDLIFTFDEKNKLIQKLATVPGPVVGYVTIRYGFNEKGLKNKEVLFNRLKEKTGAIDFTYTFSN
jgi:hypothetical protein